MTIEDILVARLMQELGPLFDQQDVRLELIATLLTDQTTKLDGLTQQLGSVVGSQSDLDTRLSELAARLDQIHTDLADRMTSMRLAQADNHAAILALLQSEPPAQPEEPVEPVDPEPDVEEPVDPEPTEPDPVEPEPEQPTDPIGVTAKINSFTDNTYWNKGIGRQKAGFSIPHSPAAEAAFVKEAHAKFADGQVRRINYVQVISPNMSVWVDGPLLDGATVGSPNSVFTTNEEIKETPMPEPEPVDPTPVTPPPLGTDRGVMGTALGMGMGKPEVVPGEIRYDYELPVEADVDRALSYGLPLFRVGSLRERLIKPGLKSELYLGTHTSQFGGQKPYSLPEIRNFCAMAGRKGGKVMLDLMHNYGGLSETGDAHHGHADHKKIGTSGGPSYDVFANDWFAIIQYLKQDPEAWAGIYGFDIMNEWINIPNDNVFQATQRFLDVCAPIMDDKLAILEGNSFSNAPNFHSNNAQFVNLVDPRGPGFIEMSAHLYSDQDMSGMYTTPDAYKSGQAIGEHGQWAARAKPFLDFCDANGWKKSIGEWIVPGDYPFLLEDAERGIAYALERGCNVIVFGMGKGFGSNAHHNLEIARNVPTLNAVKRLAAL